MKLITKSEPKRGATPINKHAFRPELASIETKSNRQRWLEYQAKLAAMEVAA